MTPEILFEDQDIIVLNKPSGMIVNRADTTKGEITVQDFLENYLHLEKGSAPPTDSYNTEEVFRSRAGIVHRLDKETSGILLVAKNVSAFENLQKQFKERTVRKVYIALAHGKIEPEIGEIKAPIGRLPWNRKQFGVLADGREAVTKYKVLEIKTVEKEQVSLVELYPETGRTHQIRVHLKYINHPVFADFLYAGRKTSRNDRKLLNRVFLHASHITFTHPKTNEKVEFDCRLSEELVRVLEDHLD